MNEVKARVVALVPNVSAVLAPAALLLSRGLASRG
jgi:hypothetical protein